METKVFWIDLFSGAGGTTTGIHLADEDMKVVACVNHDQNAIESHKANHPECLHFVEDVRDFKVVIALKNLVKKLRKEYPGCLINIWASLECTNYSKAKGGLPRNADSRTLANALFMYLEHLNPDYLYIENVREFMAWGPLDENGRPISRKNGRDYIKWVNKVQSYGYNFDYKLLNAADYGAYTSRERYFGQFAKKGYPIYWPEQTHAKTPGGQNGLFNPLKKWNAVRKVLDFEDEGKSIFNRKKPLADKTINVIINGIKKAIEEGEKDILFKYYGNGNNLNSINIPAGSVTTKDRFAKLHFIFNQYKTGNTTSIQAPLNTITTIPKSLLVSFIMNPSYFGHTSSINKPCPVIIARQDKSTLYLIQVMEEYGVIDIKMRMLKIPELLKIQGFPENYKLKGTKTEQKKYIGNAVEVNMAKAITKANFDGVANFIQKQKAS